MHGATYTVDVEFEAPSLVEGSNWVMDIGQASSTLEKVLKKYNLRNLDEIFTDGENTTTEFMCKVIFDDLVQECPDFEGTICVKLHESHRAWACYSGYAGPHTQESSFV